MKYFTPELLERVGSLDDDVADAAHADWERAVARWLRRWQKIKPAFPADVQRLVDEQVCLHDALILSIARQRDTLVVVLQRESPAQDLVLLTFTLEGEPQIDPAALPAEHGTGGVTWMYEEFDLDRHQRCWFEVLLSNGWAVKLCFRDFRFLIAQKILAVTTGQIVGPVTTVVPRSA